ncbi:LPS translocon maturation chaperone LptM [Faunimonas sp. B44]|uniref:LPS translocon maturation chaperone LptM n=1 Tax=Faunimonas sp. B44 TaxID=3461493 RepID=UPI004043CB34
MAAIRIVLILALAAASVAGCGRRGPLEPPPGPAAAEPAALPRSGPVGPNQAPAAAEPAGDGFLLDPLL